MAAGLHCRALPASEVAQRLCEVASSTFGAEPVVLHVASNAGTELRTEKVAATSLLKHQVVATFIRNYSGKAHVECSSASVTFREGQAQQHPVSVTYQSPEGIVATINLVFPNDTERAARALTALEEHFKVTSHVDLIRSKLPPPEAAALQMRERGVAELERELERLATFLSELARRETETRRQMQEELERSFREREAKLDEQFREKQDQLERRDQERRDSLEKRALEHEERVKQFETREAKHVRRDLLKKIETVLAGVKDFEVGDATTKKRRLVHVFTWLLMAISATIGGAVLYRIATHDPVDWRLFLPLAAASATLVTTFVYYLKWNDRWFREHADNEFAATRYQADILRASWVAELVSEWASETGEDVPPELLSAFTRNLFRDIGGSRESEHPLEALTGMMKRVTAVTVGKGTISVRGAGPEVGEPRKLRPKSKPDSL